VLVAYAAAFVPPYLVLLAKDALARRAPSSPSPDTRAQG
jgi:hypothetical protein